MRVFAVLEDYRAGSAERSRCTASILRALPCRPRRQVVDPAEFAVAVSEAYRWSLTPDIVEELVPRFEAKGWLRQSSATATAAAYEIIYQGAESGPVGEAVSQVVRALVDISNEFQMFIAEISPLTAVSRTKDELSDILIEWLVSIDAYTEDVLRQKVIQTTNDRGKLGISVELPDDSLLTSEDRYLCARLYENLYDEKSQYIQDLCKIASVGLLTEVIQDFRQPTSSVKRTNIVIYLDGPVAMDFMGVSGKAVGENIQPIIRKLQSSGASVRIFRVSVQELQKALQAVLGRQPSERTGPTAEAIRRNEVLEAFVRQVAKDPDSTL